MASSERPRPFVGPSGIFEPRDPGLYRSPGEKMRRDDQQERQRRNKRLQRQQGRRW